jgi:glycerophosphoryl diester phosphodiesterase
MPRARTIALVLAGLVLGGLYLGNASWRGDPKPEQRLLAHRGVHQTFRRDGLDANTCTAAQSEPSGHAFLENTIPSMRRAFELGADVVEIDVHPTTDGDFIVFHDWTVDCRTNGHGVTRTLSVAQLKALDIGHGYTSDGGRTFPFRGRGVSLAPTLDEVLTAFPGRAFMINVKSNDPTEGDRLAAYLTTRHPAVFERVVFMGGERPMRRLQALRPGARVLTKRDAQACLTGYIATGWMGRVPAPCRDTMVFVPQDYAGLFWGWPNLFLQRMQRAGSQVYVSGAVDLKNRSMEGLDDPQKLARLPKGWRGGIATDKVEVIGPAWRR